MYDTLSGLYMIIGVYFMNKDKQNHSHLQIFETMFSHYNLS